MFEIQTIEADGLWVGRFMGILDANAAEQIAEFIETKELEAETGFNRFCDMTHLEGIHLLCSDVRQMAARRRGFNPNYIRVKSAFLAIDPLAFGVARMYEQMLNSPRIDVRVWGDIQAAAAWLGVDAGKLAI